MYNTTKSFWFTSEPYIRNLMVEVTSGSVTIEVFDDQATPTYVQSDVIITQGVSQIYTSNSRMRIIPSGDAKYFIQHRPAEDIT